MVSLRQAYDESENPVVSTVRTVTDTIGSWFDENETAQVMRLMKSMDPAFNREGFERDLREYIVPEVVDAYLSADQDALKAWCGEAVCALHFLLSMFLCKLPRHITCFGLQWRCSSAKVLLVIVKFSIFAKLMYGFVPSLY